LILSLPTGRILDLSLISVHNKPEERKS